MRRHAPACGPLRSRDPAAALRRRAASRCRGACRPACSSAVSATRSRGGAVPARLDVVAHRSAGTRCGCASMRSWRPVHAVRGPTPRPRSRSTPVRSSSLARTTSCTARTSTSGVLDLADWARDALVLAMPAQIVCRRRLPGPVPGMRGEPERGRSRAAPPRGGGRPALGEAAGSEAGADCHAGRSATIPASMAVPKAETVALAHQQAPLHAQGGAAGRERVPAVPLAPPPAPGLPGMRLLRRAPGRDAPHLPGGRAVARVAVDAQGADLGPGEVAAGVREAAAAGARCVVFGPAAALER